MDGLTANRTALIASLVGAALVAWLVVVETMRGMDAGPGTDLGSLAWFIGAWITMMGAMMLPSAAPAVLLFSRFRRGDGPWLFVLGYLLVWAGFGLVAYAVYRAVRLLAPEFVAWDEYGPVVAGAALVVAGLYQLLPLKEICLRHCRSPLHFMLHSQPGRRGAVRTGIGHGAYCVGCCAGLMLALFALGVMSLFRMVLVASAIFVEKVLRGGETVALVLAVLLVGLGFWIAASPATVPGLTEPGLDVQP